MSNRIVTRYASLLLAAFVIGGCQDDEPTGVDTLPFDVSPISFALDQGGTKTVKLTGIANADVTWESTNTAVATVSPTGVVTGVAPGFASITARSKANPTTDLASATFQVVAVTGILVTPGTPITGISAAANAKPVYRVFVPEGATNLTITTSGGTGDLDLYVRYAAIPVTTGPGAGTFDCRPYLAGNNESCSRANPPEGSHYIVLHAYEAFAGVTLTVTRTP